MRRPDVEHVSQDLFRDGVSFDLVVKLYEFDSHLRNAIFSELTPIELAFRTLIGHSLGRLDPLIHYAPDTLGAKAREVGSLIMSDGWRNLRRP